MTRRFDVTYHVRRSALPKPGTEAQLRELVGRIMSRPLDRSRPLWEMYLVEGPGADVSRSSARHHAMVDGISAVDIEQVILDVDPEPRKVSSDEWRPSREPTGVELMAGAVGDIVKSPANAVDNVRSGLADLHRTASSFGKHAVGIAAAAMTVARSARRVRSMLRSASNGATRPRTRNCQTSKKFVAHTVEPSTTWSSRLPRAHYERG